MANDPAVEPPKRQRSARKAASDGAKPQRSRRNAKAQKPELPPRDQLITYYRDMLAIRRFEEKAGQLYGMGLIGGFCHLYIGQEAVAVGIQHALKPGDSVITGYRDHGHMLACGMEMPRVMAELTGRVGGYSKGKGGSMHMFAAERGFYGGHGIVGAQVPLGAGIAFAHKYRDDGGVCCAFFGDGAANQGQVYETFNMAALWQLPVVFIIENNRYGMGTAVSRAAAGQHLHERGVAYGIPGSEVDGMDVLAVRQAADEAVAYARGTGPVILEALTYRYRGHSMSDPAKYRSKSEVAEMRERHDPIETLRQHMVDAGLADDAELKAIDKEIRAAVRDAERFAQESPEPDPRELTTDVLVDA